MLGSPIEQWADTHRAWIEALPVSPPAFLWFQENWLLFRGASDDWSFSSQCYPSGALDGVYSGIRWLDWDEYGQEVME